MTSSPEGRVFLIEDWRPVAPDLATTFESLGHETVVLPNILELVLKRVRRDRPWLMAVNASSLLMGEARRWRALLGGPIAGLLVVPSAAPPAFYESARFYRFDALLDAPVSAAKLELALDIVGRTHAAARRLRLQVERLTQLQQSRYGSAAASIAAPSATAGPPSQRPMASSPLSSPVVASAPAGAAPASGAPASSVPEFAGHGSELQAADA